MYNFFVKDDCRQADRYIITGADHNHIKNVLRMKVGDTILISANGKSDLCEIETIDNIDDGNGRQEYTLTFTPSEARYLKVIANSVTEIPDWHTGKGSPGFLFVDEIIVK